MTALDAISMLKRALFEECSVDPERVTAEVDLLDDLDIDSLDLLNATFRLEKDCGIKLPVKLWLADKYGDAAGPESPFIVRRICAYLEGHRDDAVASASAQ